jgi:predicted branched-subunit amino acid permease
MKLIENIKKNQKIIKISIGVCVLLILGTIKGYILSEYGFNIEFWGLELLTTIFTISFLIYLWKSIQNGIYITIDRKNGKQ